ncbi:hypothetical protein ACIP6V_23890 [Streptomyces sp. NPDC088770]|uniref:hypothetical protein n=1 Tax=Streptomyces sp. NPDC088770 TaxID=3365895 RepID=UPI00382EB970
MKKRCEACGESFEAKRKTARFCSDRCRMRAHRRPAEGEQPAPVTSQPPVQREDGSESLAAAARGELAAVGRDRTAAGQAVLVLARRIDANSAETGSSLAAMVREFRAALAGALEGAGEAVDPVDELRARRDRKRSG